MVYFIDLERIAHIDYLLTINIIKSMYSNGYRTSFINSRFKIEHSHDLQSHTFLSITRQQHEDSLLILKTDLLAKKLRQKKPVLTAGSKLGHSTLEYSRLSNLKSTKSPEAIRQSTQYDWQQSDLKIKREQAAVQNEIDLLEERTIDVDEKCKQVKQFFQLHISQIYGFLDHLQQIIREIQERTASCSPLRKEFRIYTDLFQSCRKQSPSLKKINVRKPTVSSAGKEASLLLSFKKNMEEEEGYMTLKYSEESAIREPNDTLVEGWQSFQKEKRSRLGRKAEYKQVKDSGIIPEQMQEQFYQTVKEQVISHLNGLKNDLHSSAVESSRVLLKFQNLLDEIVQQIAEQKVEREHEWKALKKSRNEQIDLMSFSLTQLKNQTLQYQLDIDSKIHQLEEQFADRLSAEMSERKLQEKLMIKMMLDVVQFLK